MTIYANLPVLNPAIEWSAIECVASRQGENNIYRVEDIPQDKYVVVGALQVDFFRTHPKRLTFSNDVAAEFDRDSFWKTTPTYTVSRGQNKETVAASEILPWVDEASQVEVFQVIDLMRA